jgi:hypothetical protein
VDPGLIRPPGGAPSPKGLERAGSRHWVPTELAPARAIASASSAQAVRRAGRDKPRAAPAVRGSVLVRAPAAALAHAREDGSPSAWLRARAYAPAAGRQPATADARTNVWL